MQRHAPEAVDLATETEATQGDVRPEPTRSREPFGRQCLLARRLVERGVRFIQIYSGGNHNDANWDAHGDMAFNHNLHAGETDKPIAGSAHGSEAPRLAGGDAGRLGRRVRPAAHRGIRRLAPAATTTATASRCGWPAAASKAASRVGATDELGAAAVENPFHVKHLHATMLSLMGLDPERLTYFYGGLDQKLVGVEGAEPIREVMA